LGEQLHLIAPEGGRIENLQVTRIDTRGGEPGDSNWIEGSYQGLQVWNKTLRIGALESVEITYTVVTAPGATGTLSVRKSPVMPPEIAYWNEPVEKP
jgi:hypothetical protein